MVSVLSSGVLRVIYLGCCNIQAHHLIIPGYRQDGIYRGQTLNFMSEISSSCLVQFTLKTFAKLSPS